MSRGEQNSMSGGRAPADTFIRRSQYELSEEHGMLSPPVNVSSATERAVARAQLEDDARKVTAVKKEKISRRKLNAGARVGGQADGASAGPKKRRKEKHGSFVQSDACARADSDLDKSDSLGGLSTAVAESLQPDTIDTVGTSDDRDEQARIDSLDSDRLTSTGHLSPSRTQKDKNVERTDSPAAQPSRQARKCEDPSNFGHGGCAREHVCSSVGS